MHRRRVLALVAVTLSAHAGCSSGGASDDTPRQPRQVTTSAADSIEILVSQIAIADGAAGPDAYYRLRNAGDADATIRVETVLSVEGGGTYSSFAVVSVPAGDEVTVRYRIVDFAALSDAEARAVRTGDGVDFTTRINGREREGP